MNDITQNVYTIYDISNKIYLWYNIIYDISNEIYLWYNIIYDMSNAIA